MKDTNKTFTIYAIRCKNTGRMYIGCTSNLEARFQAHMWELKGGHKNTFQGKQMVPTLWQADFNEYGENAFELYVLQENVPFGIRAETENAWIDKYKSYLAAYGYNRRRNAVTCLSIAEGLPPLPQTDAAST